MHSESEIGISHLEFYLPEESCTIFEYAQRPEDRSVEEMQSIWIDTEDEMEVLLRYFHSQTAGDCGNFIFPAPTEADAFAKETGIDHLYCATENASEMAVRVGKRLLAREPNLSSQIHMLICYHSTINQAPSWGIACRLQYELELGKIPIFTISQKAGNCGFVALKVAWEALKSEPDIQSVLLVGCEKLVPPYKRGFGKMTATGDSATALLLRRGGERCKPICFRIRDYPDWWNPYQYDAAKMQALIGFLAQEAASLMNEVLVELNVNWADVACLIPPNFNLAFVSALAAKVPIQNIYARNISRFGYLLSSDLPINLATILQEGHLRHGDLALILTMGLGLSLGCIAMII